MEPIYTQKFGEKPDKDTQRQVRRFNKAVQLNPESSLPSAEEVENILKKNMEE